MRHILLLSCIAFLATINTTNAQYWEVSGMGGVTFYHGDLAPDFSMQTPGAAGSFFVRRNVDPRVSLRIGASFGTISASDKNSLNEYNKARNLSFQSTIFEGSVGLEFNFLPFHHHSQKGRNHNQFSPYLVAGFGVFHHNPKAEYKGSLYELQPLGTEGQSVGEEYSLIQPSLILGAGIKIDINSEWGIVIEGATRILFFDYLDDVAGEYADSRLIASHRGSLASAAIGLADRSGEVGQNLGRPGRQRGDSKTNDGYTMFTIGILYTMHQYHCPSW
ncbi:MULTISPECIES: DUF6089 family protein [unclassified Aureispira]|uniref:type IX secretion system protein PorG n=1 Tax=unclassified Aureispira TaxID=2649989 RepID=UPI0007C7AC2D|nr:MULTISPECIES: DUF6089 family protein [unclassified Aureispira]WMX14550.1 DUF6089 family protein [Aureispira sp. CCB-E]